MNDWFYKGAIRRCKEQIAIWKDKARHDPDAVWVAVYWTEHLEYLQEISERYERSVTK